ncbi:MAG TPA: hypothetical protein VIL01_12585 [Thermomicrobiales bacterium]
MVALAFISFAVLVVAWLLAPNTGVKRTAPQAAPSTSFSTSDAVA